MATVEEHDAQYAVLKDQRTKIRPNIHIILQKQKDSVELTDEDTALLNKDKELDRTMTTMRKQRSRLTKGNANIAPRPKNNSKANAPTEGEEEDTQPNITTISRTPSKVAVEYKEPTERNIKNKVITPNISALSEVKSYFEGDGKLLLADIIKTTIKNMSDEEFNSLIADRLAVSEHLPSLNINSQSIQSPKESDEILPSSFAENSSTPVGCSPIKKYRSGPKPELSHPSCPRPIIRGLSASEIDIIRNKLYEKRTEYQRKLDNPSTRTPDCEFIMTVIQRQIKSLNNSYSVQKQKEDGTYDYEKEKQKNAEKKAKLSK
jgi:hypothetical protein